LANTEIEQLSIDTIRTLSMDMVQQANAGHPGTAMALAPLAYLLYGEVMHHNPASPHWPNRDRFILSAGHACVLQYSALHLAGIRLNFDLMTGFSLVPLQAFGLLGALVAVGGVGFGLFLFVRRLIVGAEVEGVFTLFAILFTLLGIAMAGLFVTGLALFVGMAGYTLIGNLTQTMRLPEAVRRSVLCAFERFDGRGAPADSSLAGPEQPCRLDPH